MSDRTPTSTKDFLEPGDTLGRALLPLPGAAAPALPYVWGQLTGVPAPEIVWFYTIVGILAFVWTLTRVIAYEARWRKAFELFETVANAQPASRPAATRHGNWTTR